MGDILLVTGDSSADRYAAELVEFLFERGFEGEVLAAAGEYTEAAGARLFENLVDHAVMGFAEVVTALPYFFSLASRIEKIVSSGDISAILLMDFPGFNLRLAGRLQKYEVPIFYYIPPQVWAWGKSRVNKLKDRCNELFVIFPFEVDFYSERGVEATFVGHPRLQKWRHRRPDSVHERLGLNENKRILSFFPGSRSGELKRHLPVMVETARRLQNKYSRWVPVFSVASTVQRDDFELAEEHLHLWPEDSYSLLSNSELTVLASGTVTMEATFTATPMIVGYRTSFLSYWLARWLVDVDHAAMPNHFQSSHEIPELLQYDFTPDRLLEVLEKYLDDESLRSSQQRTLESIRNSFADKNPAEEVAERLLSTLRAGSAV